MSSPLTSISWAAITLALGVGIWACTPSTSPPPAPMPAAGPPQLRIEPRTFGDIPGWSADNHAAALTAFARSCAAIARKPKAAATPGVASSPIPAPGTASAWDQVCNEAFTVPTTDAAARAFFERRFRVWLATNRGAAEGLFTGYYEPSLRGCLRPRTGCAVPLYRPPAPASTPGAVREISSPLPTRAEIEAGALKNRGLELLWLTDPIDAFFLHVQGSGRVVLDDGRVVRVGYAGKNGQPYTPIGRELVRRGALAEAEVSMQTIRAWLAGHPTEAAGVMALNASYVFFRFGDEAGPIGTQGVVLTPGRSLAVDPAHIPLGVPLFLDATDPLAPGVPLRRLVVAQDTGGAIKGVVRGDLFWGAGAEAEAAAGRMKERGRFYVLLPVGVVP